MKKFFFIIFILALIGGGYWWFFVRPNTPIETVPDIFKPFFPVGGGTVPPEGIGNEGGGTTTNNQTQRSLLTQMTSVPIAGFTLYNKPKTIERVGQNGKIVKETINDEILRYVHRKTGYVFERKNRGDAKQVSNIFLANIYEAYFGNNGTSVILRFLQEDGQTIGSYVVPIPEENSDGTRDQKQGFFLANNIKSIIQSPSTKEFARLSTERINGVITTSDFNGKNVREILSFPFKEWLLQWPTQNTLYVQTKPAGTVPGYLYVVNTTEKRLRRVLGSINGLTTSVSPTGTYILYSQSTNQGFRSFIYNTKTTKTITLDPYILPEKCVWLKNEDVICAGSEGVVPSVYPDAWYAGLIQFNDSFYRIGISSGYIETLFEPITESFDVINLSLDPREENVYFIDKTTGILWKLLI